MTTPTAATANQTRPLPDALRRAGAVVADYDQVRAWSDPAARQCELTRLGAVAVELLRQLSAAPGGAGGRR